MLLGHLGFPNSTDHVIRLRAIESSPTERTRTQCALLGRKFELEDAGPFHHAIWADPGLIESPDLPPRAPR